MAYDLFSLVIYACSRLKRALVPNIYFIPYLSDVKSRMDKFKLWAKYDISLEPISMRSYVVEPSEQVNIFQGVTRRSALSLSSRNTLA